jgi:hypothetical protein
MNETTEAREVRFEELDAFDGSKHRSLPGRSRASHLEAPVPRVLMVVAVRA